MESHHLGIGENSFVILVTLTVLSLVPAVVIMFTCFPFVVTVLSILRQSIGLSQSPPNMVVTSLALFITCYIMHPVFFESWVAAAVPLSEGKISVTQAFHQGVRPFIVFMESRVQGNDLEEVPGFLSPIDTTRVGFDYRLIPAFLLSELQRAFEVGFLISLPFFVIDLVVSAVLMSVGMMMVPPAVVSLPIKLAFFVSVGGWQILSSALINSYV
ncbi:flagellar type III secretion system pore protein FliP [Paracoccus aestuariivivens]|nr:flagellar type III secretion system pore protein FliP [Paracoccus aestuariivivens]